MTLADMAMRRDSPMIVRMLAALVAAFVMNFATQAQDAGPGSRLDDITERGALRVGMTGDYMPFTSLDKPTQKYRGFDVDMAEALGKTPIARCGDIGKYQTLADIDKKGTRVIVNPGGTNERFARAHIQDADITLFSDNTAIFGQIAKGQADLMITDASETRFQQKQVRLEQIPPKSFDPIWGPGKL
jgi:cyclohexadienyl dehydratase